jgi:hypothetical protein
MLGFRPAVPVRTEPTDLHSQEEEALKVSRRSVIVVVIAGLVGAGSIAAWRAGSDRRARQEVVARRGAIVMPFDLDRTTHVFQPASYGGDQTIVADEPTDLDQIRLIREHLQAEAAAFARGDFGDPAQIHSDEMPGLRELEANYQAIEVTYEPTTDGARITYRSSDASVVDALYDWFAAQVSDHGPHAEP